jgi:hypothetical protein
MPDGKTYFIKTVIRVAGIVIQIGIAITVIYHLLIKLRSTIVILVVIKLIGFIIHDIVFCLALKCNQ